MSPLEIDHSPVAPLADSASKKREQRAVGSCPFDCTGYMLPSSLSCLAASTGAAAAAVFHAPMSLVAGLAGVASACTGAVCLQGFQAGGAAERRALGDAADDVGDEVKHLEELTGEMVRVKEEFLLQAERLELNKEQLESIAELFNQLFSKYKKTFEVEDKKTRETLEELQQKEDQIQELIDRLSSVKVLNDELHIKVGNLTNKIKEAKKFEVMVDESKTVIEELKAEIVALNVVIGSSLEKIEEAKKTLEEERRQKAALQISLKEIQRDLDHSRSQIEESLGASFASFQEALTAFIEVKKDLERSLGGLEEGSKALRETEELLRQEALELKEKTRVLQKQLEEIDIPMTEGIRHIVELLNALEDKDISFLSDFVTAEPMVRDRIRGSYSKVDSIKESELIEGESS